MTAVSIRGVSKHFGAGVTALQGIDLDVEPGEFVSLIGPSGCGKSTLLRIIGDLTKPTAGTVEVSGKTCHWSSCTGAGHAGAHGSRTCSSSSS